MKKMLALLLTLCLLAGMVPLGAGAIEPKADGVYDVATADELFEAISKSEDGVETTVRLTADLTVAKEINIPAGETIVLDLNGHKIASTVDGYTLVNYGTLTINDKMNNGIVCNTSTVAESKKTHFILRNYGTMTINGGTFGDTDTNRENENKANWGAAIINLAGTCTINGGYFTCGDNYWSAKPAGADYSYAIRNSDQTATMLFKGGTVYGKMNGGIAADNGVITIDDGNFSVSGTTSYYVLVTNTSNGGKIVVNGGTFTKNNYSNDKKNGGLVGGFSGMPSWDAAESLETLEKNGFTITGGTFAMDDESVNLMPIAEVNDKQYFSLNAAISAATENATVKLLKDTDENITIAEGKSIVLDLNGCTLNGGTKSKSPALTNYGKVTIIDTGDGTGTIKRSDTSSGTSYYTILNEGSMTFEAGKVENNSGKEPPEWSGSSLVCNGAEKDSAVLTINGGTFSQDNFIAIKNDEYGTLVINEGAVIESKTQAVQNWCEATINGGTLTGDVTSWTYLSTQATTTITGGTITGELQCTKLTYDSKEATNKPKLDISGTPKIDGTIEVGRQVFNQNASYKADKTCADVSISGGYFTSDPSEYCDDGLTGVANTGSNSSTYPFTVGESKVKVETAVAAGVPTVSVRPGIGVTAETVKEAVKAEATQTSLQKAAKLAGLSNDEKVVGTKEEAEKALTDKSIPIKNQTVTVVVQPYLDVAVKSATTTGETNSMTVEISAKYNVIATTADDPEKIELEGTESGAPKNAVIISKNQKMDVTSPVTITLPLPAGFVTGTSDKVYVQHKVYEYEAAVTETGEAPNETYTATFTNPHGFSTFVFSTETKTVATVNGTNYTNFQQAVDAADPNDIIEVKEDGQIANDVTHSLTLKNGDNTQPITVTINGKTITIPANGQATFIYTAPTPPRPTEEKHSITISTDGKGQVTGPASAAEDDKVTLTVKPGADKELYDLKVTGEDGKAIAVTKVNDTTYTFTMPDGKVTVAATFGCDGGDNCPSKAFTDLGDKQWYHDSIDYAVENGLLEGTSPTTMEPNATLIRAQLAQILYNIEDKPAVTGEMVFEDVPASEWFYSPILWANQNEIINGTSPTTFEPLEDITRQDLALMLYRYAGEPAVTGDLDGFTDADQVGDWAEEAMVWAVAEGIVQGDTPTTLNPTGTATRAEAAAMLQRFLENAA